MWIFNAFIYYLIVIPLSLLPFRVLYLLSDCLYFVIYYLIRFRKNIVMQNVANSFPDKSKSEINDIIQKFYHHFSDLIFESVKLFSISKQEVIARSKFVNAEVLNEYFEKGQSIIIVSGHYNNWEMWAQSCNIQMKHQAVGIYTPLSNKFFNKRFADSRSRYKVVLLPKDKVKAYFKDIKNQLRAIVFGTDQSPSPHTKRVYWTNFLNQDTAVMFGSEKYAIEYNYPVIYAGVNKIKRGWYEVEFEVLEPDPSSATYGSITEKHTRRLEQQILEHPEYYLWTHRRWKRKRSDYAD